MKSLVFKYCLFGLFSLFLFTFTGCFSSQVVQKEFPITPQKQSKTIILPKVDPLKNKPISDLEVKKNLATGMKSLFKQSPYFSHRDNIFIKIYPTYYQITFEDRKYDEQKVIKFPYKEDNQKITFFYPNTILVKYGFIGPYLAGNLEENMKAMADRPIELFNYMYNDLEKLPLYYGEIKENGEINVPYSIDSVKGNLKRSPYIVKRDTWKGNYLIKFKGKAFPVDIKMYPFHNGTKVVYSISFGYYIYSGGKIGLNKNTIQNVTNLFKKVVTE